MIVGIIGTGNLGKAILTRMIENNVEVLASSKSGGTHQGCTIGTNNKEVAQKADVVILTVKPQCMKEVLEEIKQELAGKTVISMAAGLRLGFFESRLDAKMVRTMTNMAIEKGKGMTVYKLGASCGEDEKEKAEKILGYLGATLAVDDEKMLDVATGISGSGIAYFLKIISLFEQAAEKQGMNKQEAKKVIIETIRGSLSLMEDKEIDTIITSVASKGGTTERGLKELADVEEVFDTTITKTIEKCNELGDAYGN